MLLIQGGSIICTTNGSRMNKHYIEKKRRVWVFIFLSAICINNITTVITYVGRDGSRGTPEPPRADAAVVDGGRSRVVAVGPHRAVFGVVLSLQAEEAGRARVLCVVADPLVFTKETCTCIQSCNAMCDRSQKSKGTYFFVSFFCFFVDLFLGF